jgi:hypothetical protein
MANPLASLRFLLSLTKAKEHVIREPLAIPSLETVFEVSVNGRVHKVPGSKLQKWTMKRRSEWKGPRGMHFSQRPSDRPSDPSFVGNLGE